ncbi:MAG: DoxX family membrane protein [Gemmatimonadaceae bacterium]
MKRYSLLLLRLSLGGLMVYWGIDKLINVAHGLAVAQKFYGGVETGEALLHVFGMLQVALGAFVMIGLARRVTYPMLLLVTGTTLLAVWQSIVDPFKVVVEGGNLIFYPSLIIFAGGLVLLAFREEDELSWDGRRSRAAG